MLKFVNVVEEKNKVIFLDIDGVITSARTGWFNFDIYAVNFFIWLCERSSAKLVISSTWRYNHNKIFWDKIFPECMHEDYKTPVIYTSARGEYIRGDEIKMWLDNHPETTEYLIVDDDADMLEEQKNSFIQTDGHNGLTFQNMDAIVAFFHIWDYPYTSCDNSVKKLHIVDEMFDLKP